MRAFDVQLRRVMQPAGAQEFGGCLPWWIWRVPDVLGASPVAVRPLSSASESCVPVWKGQEGEVARQGDQGWEVRQEAGQVLNKEKNQEKVQGNLLWCCLHGQQVLSCTPRSSGSPGLVGELAVCEQLHLQDVMANGLSVYRDIFFHPPPSFLIVDTLEIFAV